MSSSSDARRRRYLMCPPTYFAVRYAINPWMRPDEPVDAERAVAQWERLRAAIADIGHRVEVMEPVPNLPDIVFTANGGIVVGERALTPRFRHPERAGEVEHFTAALRGLGVEHVQQAKLANEGEGDFLLTGARMLAGYGPRSDERSGDEVAEFFGVPVVSLELVDSRFYHLDTALARLDAETVVYWPGAFTADSRAMLAELFPDAIIASADDAAALGLNMVSDGEAVIMTPECARLADEITERGFTVVPISTDELRKAGGGAKCCVLELHPAPVAA